jgi:uncharacterized membrane protein
MVSIIANIVVAAIIILMIYSAVKALRKPSNQKCSKSCSYCHDTDCSHCSRH